MTLYNISADLKGGVLELPSFRKPIAEVRVGGEVFKPEPVEDELIVKDGRIVGAVVMGIEMVPRKEEP
jgi:hypothetical protein